MEKNEINIINDLDKENDDLMTHLGILQQLSLGQKTNVLKEIKSYKDDSLDNDKSKNINNNKNFQNFEIEQKHDINLGLHLIVLVHGFEGNSNDMRIIKNGDVNYVMKNLVPQLKNMSDLKRNQKLIVSEML